MWDEFADYPMRKDYREPDDYEYEPTPHDDVLEKAKQHYAARPALDGAENLDRRSHERVSFHELEEAPPPMTSRLEGELLESRWDRSIPRPTASFA